MWSYNKPSTLWELILRWTFCCGCKQTFNVIISVCAMLPVALFWFDRKKESHGRSWWGIEGNRHVFSSSSSDPRCPFKHPLFYFNCSQGCLSANKIISYLRSSHPGVLFTGVCRDVTRDSVRRDETRWWRKQISGQCSERGNWSQNKKTNGCREEPLEERERSGGRLPGGKTNNKAKRGEESVSPQKKESL